MTAALRLRTYCAAAAPKSPLRDYTGPISQIAEVNLWLPTVRESTVPSVNGPESQKELAGDTILDAEVAICES